MSGLTFARFSEANLKRCREVWHLESDWSLTDWACAMAGEVGEACNLIKKRRRGELISPEDIGRELGDGVAYADLLAARMGIDLGEAVRRKWNEVSLREGYPERLEREVGFPAEEASAGAEVRRLNALVGVLGAETCPDCWPVARDCERCEGRGFITLRKASDA